MSYELVTGIIAKEVNYNEADRYLTILTNEYGKLECYAKGIRNQKSKLAATAGLLSFGEYKLFKNKNRYILTSGKLIEKFYDIRTDIVKYAYATHYLEIARDIVMEEQPFPEAIQTLLNTLHVLVYKKLPLDFTARVYETRMLMLAGFAPILDQCVCCGSPIVADEQSGKSKTSFSTSEFGVLCPRADCQKRDVKSIEISDGTIKALSYIISCEPKEIFSFTIGDRILKELSMIVPRYLRSHFEREYKGLDEAERYRAFEEEIINGMPVNEGLQQKPF